MTTATLAKAPWREGCRTHAQAEAEVERRWQLVAERDLEASMCICCAGPSPVHHALCTRCTAGGA